MWHEELTGRDVKLLLTAPQFNLVISALEKANK